MSDYVLGADIGGRKVSIAFCELDIPSREVVYTNQLEIQSFTSDKENQADVWADIYGWLTIVLEDEMLDHNCFGWVETPPYVRNHKVTTLLSGTYGVVMCTLAYQGFLVEGARVQEWKKEVVGAGNASKDDVGVAVRNEWEVDGDITEDEADALAIMTYGIKVLRRKWMVEDETHLSV